MLEGIRDTSAQDVVLQKNRNWQWLKWAVPGLLILVFAAFAASAFRTWLSAEASISADRIRTAVVQRGDLIRDINVQGRCTARRPGPFLWKCFPATS
jgi:HlyD family secretion protein